MRGGLAVQTQETPAGPASPPLVDGPQPSNPSDWILTPGEVADWLARSKSGDRLLYGQGQQLVRGRTSEAMRGYQRDGDVHLFQPRSATLPGAFDFIAIRRATPAALPARARVQDALDPAMRTIFQRLQRAANKGERCPTDAMLAALTQLTVPQVKWRIRKLAQAKRIETMTVWVGPLQFRIVRIVATAKETAWPFCLVKGQGVSSSAAPNPANRGQL